MLEYNGIRIELTHMKRWEQQMVTSDDGVTYLYTKITLTVEGVYNPMATSYTMEGSRDGKPVQKDGVMANVTQDAIRATLMRHRGKLVYQVGCKTVLEAPGVNTLTGGTFATDAAMGPKPINCDVVELTNTKTWKVVFTVQVCLRECPGAKTLVALISNRFTQQVSHDQEYLSTRVTHGTAVFRSDVLLAVGLAVDDFRNYVISRLPPVLGFRRVGPNVGVSSDGLVMTYEIIDIEQYYHLGDTTRLDPGNHIDPASVQYQVTRVAGSHTAEGGFTLDGKGAPPLTYTTTHVEVHGTRLANIYQLSQYAVSLCVRKLPGISDGGVDAKGYRSLITNIKHTQDMWERRVACTVHAIEWPPGQTMKTEKGDPLWCLGYHPGLMIGEEVYYPVPYKGFLFPAGEEPSPPNVGFGTANLKLFTQGIEEACQTDWPVFGNPSAATTNSSPAKGDTPSVSVFPIQVLPVGPGDVYQPGGGGGGAGASAFGSPSARSVLVAMGVLSDDASGQAPPVDSDGFSGPTGEYKLDSTYERDEGKIYVPVGGPPDAKPEILTLWNPSSVRTVKWTAERAAGMPQLPSPEMVEPDRSDFGLLHTTTTPCSWEGMPDGRNRAYRVSGEYVYGSVKATGAGSPNIPLDAPPTYTYGHAPEVGGKAIRDGSASSPTGSGVSDYWAGIIDTGDPSSYPNGMGPVTPSKAKGVGTPPQS